MNNKFADALNSSLFFNNKQSSNVGSGAYFINHNPIPTFQNEEKVLVKLNIASGPNVFPFDGWINYDKDDSTPYFRYLDWQDANRTQAYVLSEMPEHQQKLAQYIRSNGKIDFRVQDVRAGFAQHQDNSVDLIYLGQMIEHLNPIYETPLFLKDCYRMMKSGGSIRITTPDLGLILDAYMNKQMDKFAHEQPDFYKNADPASQLAYLMYGACGPSCTWTNYEGHMFLFNTTSMSNALLSVGFKDIVFYYEPGKSRNEVMAKEVVDAGLSHSFICEATK